MQVTRFAVYWGSGIRRHADSMDKTSTSQVAMIWNIAPEMKSQQGWMHDWLFLFLVINTVAATNFCTAIICCQMMQQ